MTTGRINQITIFSKVYNCSTPEGEAGVTSELQV